jgi:small-conductance mechanosensitive channel
MNLKDLTASLDRIRQKWPRKEQTGSEENELRRLDRIRLMELIVDQRKKIEELEEKLAEANSRLDARTIRLDIDHVEDKKELSRMLRLVLRELEGTFGTN